MIKRIWGNEAYSHLTVSFVYFLLLSVLRLRFDTALIWLWLGGLVGTYLLDIDHVIYWFWTHPEKDDSIKAKEIIRRIKGGMGDVGVGGIRKNISLKFIRKTIVDLYQLLKDNHQSHNRLTFHTITFQIILLILTVYVLSSGGSYFGSGLVLAMNLHLLKDIWQDYFVKGNVGVSDWFLWQIRGWGIEGYLKEYLILVTGVFLLMSELFV